MFFFLWPDDKTYFSFKISNLDVFLFQYIKQILVIKRDFLTIIITYLICIRFVQKNYILGDDILNEIKDAEWLGSVLKKNTTELYIWFV